MHRLTGTIQHYAWGTQDAIPAILGHSADGRPFAEYWLGAHTQSPATLSDGRSLIDLLAGDPDILGPVVQQRFGQLPFLLKILSARHALSIQAHPSRGQAQEGFARENAAGIPVGSPERVYSDDWPKPEVLIALEPFETLSGFRDPMTSAALFSGLGVADELQSVIGPLTERKGAAALAEVFLDALSLAGERAHLVDVVSAAAMRHSSDRGPIGEFARTAVELDAVFPGDRGILGALLMNRVRLEPGEAIFVPSGQMHAHLSGTGVEVMANSDNVIRGGLTPKHVDVGELVQVVDFEPREVEILRPSPVSPGVERYRTPCQEFDVWRIRPEGQPAALPGTGSARVLLVIEGRLEVRCPEGTTILGGGESAIVGAAESVTASGEGLAFLSASGLR